MALKFLFALIIFLSKNSCTIQKRRRFEKYDCVRGDAQSDKQASGECNSRFIFYRTRVSQFPQSKTDNRGNGGYLFLSRTDIPNAGASRPFIICSVSRRTSVTILRKSVICISFRMYFVSSATYQLHEVVPSLNEFSPRAFLSFVHTAPFRSPGVSRMFFFVFASGSLSRRIKIPVFSPRPTRSKLRRI